MEIDHVKDMRIKGAGKFFHSLVMFLTYPLRHFFKFLIFSFIAVVFLAALPMSKGVSYRHVVDWYLFGYENVSKQVSVTVKEIESKLPVASTEKFERQEVTAPRIIRKKQESQVDVRKRVFRKPLAYSQVVSDENHEQEKNEVEENINVSENTLPIIPDISDQKVVPLSEVIPLEKSYYRVDHSLPLVYEDEPSEISGQALVFSANEILVGDMYLILYGIYTDPKSYDEQAAMEYVRELVKDKILNCQIVAYTLDNVATAVCFLDGRSINQNIVDAGFAKNVAL